MRHTDAKQAQLFPSAELFTQGTRHALDYLGMWVQQSGAQRVYIESVDSELIRQCLLRLPRSVEEVSLPSCQLVKEGSWPWRITEGEIDVDVALYPFSLEVGRAFDAHAPRMMGCFRNTYSYRKLIRPRSQTISWSHVQQRLKEMGYQIEDKVGIYPPQFIFWWTLSVLAGYRASSRHFIYKDYAFQTLSKREGWSRDFSYMVMFNAQK